ncbi:MAG: carboxypeptidase regulatory-like domain-containing protein [Planctomycetes bacterium]|nr:carboxypeptidase regulatory-like domain-containing protein [Planctomycetota bacterium]
MPDDGRRRRAWAGGFAAAALAAVGFVVLRGGVGSGVPPPGAVEVPVAAGEPPADGGAAGAPSAFATVAAERAIAEAPGRAIVGRALGVDGAPLVDWLVGLTAHRRLPLLPDAARPFGSSPGSSLERRRDGWETRSDGSGRFRFDGLEVGAYTVRLVDAVGVAADCTVGPLAAAVVELRLAVEHCAVELVLTHRGERWRATRVFLRSTDGGSRWHALVDGAVCFPAPPGQYRVQVPASLRLRGRSDQWVHSDEFVADLPFAVPPWRTHLRLQLEVTAPSLELIADHGGAEPIPQLAFTLAGTRSFGGNHAEFEFAADDGKGIRLPGVPPGDWTVTARSPYFMAEPVALRLPEGASAHRLVIAGRRAAIVPLDLRTANGRPFRPPVATDLWLAGLPPLVRDGVELPCRDVGPSLLPRRDGPVPGFAGVPPGRAEWPLVDRTVDGQLVFLPFEPASVQPFEVRAGDATALTVGVAPRAFVELIGCRSNGMEWPQARVRVHHGDRLVRPLGAPDGARWQAFLPPGEYRVVVARADGEREQALFVRTQDVSLRLRP